MLPAAAATDSVRSLCRKLRLRNAASAASPRGPLAACGGSGWPMAAVRWCSSAKCCAAALQVRRRALSATSLGGSSDSASATMSEGMYRDGWGSAPKLAPGASPPHSSMEALLAQSRVRPAKARITASCPSSGQRDGLHKVKTLNGNCIRDTRNVRVPCAQAYFEVGAGRSRASQAPRVTHALIVGLRVWQATVNSA